MTNDRREQKPGPTFEKDLESVQAAWTRLDRAEPPDLLDQAILNSAARALESGPAPWWKRRPVHWAGATATAMVLALTLTLVIRQDPMAPAPMTAPVQMGQDELKQDRDDSVLSKKVEAETDGSDLYRRNLQEKLVRSQSRTEPAGDLEEHLAAPAPPQSRMAATAGQREELSSDPAGTAEVAEMADSIMTPEEWIMRLLELQKSGKEQAFTEELAAFRAAYPEYPLPPGLKD